MHPTEEWLNIEQSKTWPVPTLLKKLKTATNPRWNSRKNCQSFATIENEHTLDPKGDTSRRAKEWRTSWSLRSNPRRKTQMQTPPQLWNPTESSEHPTYNEGQYENFGMIESVDIKQPRLTMATSSRRLRTKWLPSTLSNCQVSSTPESQSRQGPEPYSSKQKAQY